MTTAQKSSVLGDEKHQFVAVFVSKAWLRAEVASLSLAHRRIVSTPIDSLFALYSATSIVVILLTSVFFGTLVRSRFKL
jgi:hypothetical protein